METGNLKVTVRIEGTKRDGTEVNKEIVLKRLSDRLAGEALTGIADLFDALVRG